MIIAFEGKNIGTLDTEETVGDLASVIRARIRGEKDVSVRRYMRQRYAAFLKR